MHSHRSSAVAASPIAALSVVALLAAACGKAPPAPPVPPALTIAAAPEAKTSAPLTITASADANPDRPER